MDGLNDDDNDMILFINVVRLSYISKRLSSTATYIRMSLSSRASYIHSSLLSIAEWETTTSRKCSIDLKKNSRILYSHCKGTEALSLKVSTLVFE